MIVIAATESAHVESRAIDVGEDRAGALMQEAARLRGRNAARMAPRCPGQWR